MKVAIANFGGPTSSQLDFASYWATHVKPPGRGRMPPYEMVHDWGFHMYSLGMHLLYEGTADEVEYWDYSEERGTAYHSNGILRVLFHNTDDVQAYLDRYGYPDLYVNHGPGGQGVLDLLEGKTFRVHVPALRKGRDLKGNLGAECYLVDSEEYLDDRSLLYIPVVNTREIYPGNGSQEWDFIYLASNYDGKRHDLILEAARQADLSGHLHPVDGSELDLEGTRISTSTWDEVAVLDLLHRSRIAVYPGDRTSSPAAMWECVAAGLPIVVNRNIQGGKHLVVSGVTGELASEEEFADVMRHVLEHRDSYSPRSYFVENWDTTETVERYLQFFHEMGWSPRT